MRVETFRRRLARFPNSREMDEVSKTLERMIMKFMRDLTGDTIEDEEARMSFNEGLSSFIEMLLEKRGEDVKKGLRRRKK
jgi:uncharacterized protein (UPF0305 family)